MKPHVESVMLGAMAICAAYAAITAIAGGKADDVLGGAVAAAILFVTSLPFHDWTDWH